MMSAFNARGNKRLFYDEFFSYGGYTKLYRQKLSVKNQPNPPSGPLSCKNNRPEGYADYRPGLCYISTYEIIIPDPTALGSMDQRPLLRMRPRLTGRAIKFNSKRGFGHIQPDDYGMGSMKRGVLVRAKDLHCQHEDEGRGVSGCVRGPRLCPLPVHRADGSPPASLRQLVPGERVEYELEVEQRRTNTR